MAKKIFLSDIDLSLNQLVQGKFEILATDPVGSKSRFYYNSTINKFKYHNGTAWLIVIDDTDARLTDARTPTSHVIATNLALGAQHSIAGATAGQVLRASSATAANFQALDHGDLTSKGTNTHAQIDTHIAAVVLHRQINDAGASATELFSAQKILQLIGDLNSTITGGLVNKGGYDAVTNTPKLDATPIAGIKNGWTYIVTAPGNFFTESVQIGDMIIAKQDSPTTLTHWTVINKNIPDIINASEVDYGLAQFATDFETLGGISIQRAVHPHGLKHTLDNRPATEAQTGLIEIATPAEAVTGTDSTRAITPATLKAVMGTTGSLVGARKFTQAIGNGTLTSYEVTHNLGSRAVVTSINNAATFEQVECEVVCTSENSVSFNFNIAPANNSLIATIVG